MPIWINERSDGQEEFECSCDCCGQTGLKGATAEEASQDFCPTQCQDADGNLTGEVEYLCSVCLAVIEEGHSDDHTVTVARVVAILQRQGRGLSFQPGTAARETVEQLVREAATKPGWRLRTSRVDIICELLEGQD